MPPGNHLEGEMGGLVLPVAIDVVSCCTNEGIPITFCRPNIMDKGKSAFVFLDKRNNGLIVRLHS